MTKFHMMLKQGVPKCPCDMMCCDIVLISDVSCIHQLMFMSYDFNVYNMIIIHVIWDQAIIIRYIVDIRCYWYDINRCNLMWC